MEAEYEAVATVSADAAVAEEAAIALNEQAATEMETECEAVAREAAVALNEQAAAQSGDRVRLRQ